MTSVMRALILLAIPPLLLAGLGSLVIISVGIIGGLGIGIGIDLAILLLAESTLVRLLLARPATPADHPRIHDVLDRLAQRAGIPTPALYVLTWQQPNVLVAGRGWNRASVMITTGFLKTASYEQLTGALANAVALIDHDDVLCRTLLAFYGLLFPPAPLDLVLSRSQFSRPLSVILGLPVTLLTMLVIGRQHAFRADQRASKLCGRLEWVVDALAMMDREAAMTTVPMASLYSITPLCIVRPMPKEWLASNWQIQPAMADRLDHLKPRPYQVRGEKRAAFIGNNRGALR